MAGVWKGIHTTQSEMKKISKYNTKNAHATKIKKKKVAEVMQFALQYGR